MTTPTISASARTQALGAMALEPWLDVGDPLAEAVVTILRSYRGALADPLPTIRRLTAEGDSTCEAFLREVETPPDWADFDRMRLGGNMAYRYFPLYLVAMTHGGLLTTFCSADAAYVPTRTNRLEHNVVRRMYESSEMFFGVLDADELRPGSIMWTVCVRVRLLHSMVRLNLLRAEAWPLPGKPINAVHTAAGPLFFGSMILDRLRLLGATITDDEADGYYLIWRYVTRLLGVPPELLGNTATEQRAIDERILPLAFDPDDNSRRLATALIIGLTNMPGAERLPCQVHEVLARRMLGEKRADAMGIPAHPLGTRVAAATAIGVRPYGWVQRLPFVRAGAEHLGRQAAESIVRKGLRGMPPTFQT